MTTDTTHPDRAIETPNYDGEDYKPGMVANYMLDKANAEGKPMSPMKLQKIVYMSYGWVRAALGKRLFDEGIEAWEHGPVIPSLYHEFKRFGWGHITDRCVQFHPFSVGDDKPSKPAVDLTDDEISVLDMVWDAYKSFTAANLREQTHIEDTPWHNARYPKRDGVPVRGGIIDDREIKDHFANELKEPEVD